MQDHDYTTRELDAIGELIHSLGFTLFCERIEAEIERGRDELERVPSEAISNFHRGQLKALRLARQIPYILQDEIKAALKEEI